MGARLAGEPARVNTLRCDPQPFRANVFALARRGRRGQGGASKIDFIPKGFRVRIYVACERNAITEILDTHAGLEGDFTVIGPNEAGVESASAYLDAGIPVIVHVLDVASMIPAAATEEARQKAVLNVRLHLKRIEKRGGAMIWSPRAGDADGLKALGIGLDEFVAMAGFIIQHDDPALPLPEAAAPKLRRVATPVGREALSAIYAEAANAARAAAPDFAEDMADLGVPYNPQQSDDPIFIVWADSGAAIRNWGDKLNPVMAALLSDRPVAHGRARTRSDTALVHRMIGSSLAGANMREAVYGTGFIDSGDVPKKAKVLAAVRGPLSQRKLTEAGIEAPALFGDLALLMPLFYRPTVEKTYDLGIIQHFRDAQNEPMPVIPAGMKVRKIDILGSITGVVDAILSCREVCSSSLHGLIASHAYGVPGTWIKFGDWPVGDDFKFRDYLMSAGWDAPEPFLIEKGRTSAAELVGEKITTRSLVDVPKLIAACPFIDEARKAELIARAERDFPRIPDVRFLAPASAARPGRAAAA